MTAADFDPFAHVAPPERRSSAPVDAPISTSPIDSVSIKMAAGYNVISPVEWQRLGKNERFDLIKANRVVFLNEGVAVPARAALRWLSINVDSDGMRG